MSAPTKARVSLADEVYAQLKSDIANFVLVPGDRFSEGEICDRLEVSRTPVRQALVRLQQDRFDRGSGHGRTNGRCHQKSIWRSGGNQLELAGD
jgi:DNA-binding GntR family transcriptional regulator